jgi:hypothetical protein
MRLKSSCWAPDREDLVYRFRTCAAAVGFDSLELRVPGAMRGVRAGEPLMIVVAPGRNGYWRWARAVSGAKAGVRARVWRIGTGRLGCRIGSVTGRTL